MLSNHSSFKSKCLAVQCSAVSWLCVCLAMSLGLHKILRLSQKQFTVYCIDYPDRWPIEHLSCKWKVLSLSPAQSTQCFWTYIRFMSCIAYIVSNSLGKRNLHFKWNNWMIFIPQKRINLRAISFFQVKHKLALIQEALNLCVLWKNGLQNMVSV